VCTADCPAGNGPEVGAEYRHTSTPLKSTAILTRVGVPLVPLPFGEGLAPVVACRVMYRALFLATLICSCFSRVYFFIVFIML
jgi:hypothetical protein